MRRCFGGRSWSRKRSSGSRTASLSLTQSTGGRPTVTDELLLAIDIGTGSCRAALFDPAGHQITIAGREYAHRQEEGIDGSQVFETSRNWELICECVREALAAAPAGPDAVRAVSTTSMREGMVLWDERDNEIWACPNVDSRASKEAAELIQSGAAEE